MPTLPPSGPPTAPPGWPPTTPPAPPSGGEIEPPPSNRSKVLAIALGAIALVAAIVVTVFLLSGDDDEDDDATPSATSIRTEETEAPATTVEPQPEPTDAPTTQAPETTVASTPATTGPTEDTASATTVPVTTETPVTTGVPGVPGGSGTRDDPFTLGSEAPVGGTYEITVLDVDLDATDAVLAADPINEPPPPGETYVVIRVAARYVGESTGTPYFDLGVGVVASDDTEFDDTGCTAQLTDDMVNAPELAPGDVAEGTFCTTIPESLVGGVDAFVQLFTEDSTTVYWLVER